MEISGKQKTFFEFFLSFLKSSLNLENFQKKMTLIANVFRKLSTPKEIVRSMTKKSLFKRSAEKEHGKCYQTLFKFEGQHLYHNY